MDDMFIVTEGKSTEPLGGLPAKKDGLRKWFDTPAKKGGLIILSVLLVVAVCYYRYTGKDDGDDKIKRPATTNQAVGHETVVLTSEPSKVFKVRSDQDWYFRVKSGWTEEIKVYDLDNPSAKHSIGPGKHFTTSGIKRFQLAASDIKPSNGPVVMELWFK